MHGAARLEAATGCLLALFTINEFSVTVIFFVVILTFINYFEVVVFCL